MVVQLLKEFFNRLLYAKFSSLIIKWSYNSVG